jgi:hypothetical protein
VKAGDSAIWVDELAVSVEDFQQILQKILHRDGGTARLVWSCTKISMIDMLVFPTKCGLARQAAAACANAMSQVRCCP